MREWKSMWKDFSPFHQGMGPCLHELFFRFIQPPSAWHPHQYLHTSSFLGLFIFLGPFCTVTKFCSTEVDGICRWYQSLLSLPVRTQDGGSEEGTGWEQEEYRAMRKAVRLLFENSVCHPCSDLWFTWVYILCDAFGFLHKWTKFPTLLTSHCHHEVKMGWPSRSLTIPGAWIPGTDLWCTASGS